MGEPKDVVAFAKKVYGPYLDAEDRVKVADMDAGDAAYFWTMLYYELEHKLARDVMRDAEQRIAKRLEGVPTLDSATPLADAERSVSASGWFGGSHLIGEQWR